MLKIILERDVELGAYLQEQVDKRSIQLEDHAIVKEAKAIKYLMHAWDFMN